MFRLIAPNSKEENKFFTNRRIFSLDDKITQEDVDCKNCADSRVSLSREGRARQEEAFER